MTYEPVPHDHEAFLRKAMERAEFRNEYVEREEEYLLAREMIAARMKSGLTQEAVAVLMETTKSAVSRLEAGGKHAPSLRTLKKYARAVGCRLEIKLVPDAGSLRHSARPHGRRTSG